MSVFQKFINSRKFWAFLAGLLTTIGAAMQDGLFTQEEVWAIVGLIGTYIFSIAFEDGMSARVNWNSIAPRTAVEQNFNTEKVEIKTDA